MSERRQLTEREEKRYMDAEIWRWAARILHGEGAALRSGHRISPVMHLLAGDGRRMLCSGGKAIAGFVPVTHRRCSSCMAQARVMWDDLDDEEATDGR